jgi:hypothetical protein
MECKTAMAFAETLVEQHITGSTMTVKVRDTESISFLTMMSMMDNGKTATDQVKQCAHIMMQE